MSLNPASTGGKHFGRAAEFSPEHGGKYLVVRIRAARVPGRIVLGHLSESRRNAKTLVTLSVILASLPPSLPPSIPMVGWPDG